MIPGVASVENHQDLRAGVRDLCKGSPHSYWRDLDARRAYPDAFVTALDGAGYLAALIPEEFGGSGLGIAEASISPPPPGIRDDLGLSPVQTGLLWTTTTIAMLFAAVPVGYTANRFGSRWPLIAAAALMPLALLWFGLGVRSVVFVVVHSVLWPMAVNTYTGFASVPPTLRRVGQNFGLAGWRLVAGILLPAAFPYLLSGIKIGWAFAWRTIIAAEMVFGVAGSQGGLGWFIYQNRFEMNTDLVFAGLLTVIIIIGLAVENLLFKWLERRTVLRWGMTAAH